MAKTIKKNRKDKKIDSKRNLHVIPLVELNWRDQERYERYLKLKQ